MTTIAVERQGAQTTVQDLPGRLGLWHVGVPPSGAWDDWSFALANVAVGNEPGAAGLESVLTGPRLRFDAETVVCVAGAAPAATVDGAPAALGRPLTVPAGGLLDVGPARGRGLRAYVAVRGGLDVPEVLGSRATFTLGGFGGSGGRPLRKGDALGTGGSPASTPRDVADLLPDLGAAGELRVLLGPYGAPEHLTDQGVRDLVAATWTVDHRADRTGIRLNGPRPGWARGDGGEAGLHPSNIHDSAYPVGGIMLAGDNPVVVGPDGPSLGGFVVPAVVIGADHWKLAQLRPGDELRLRPVSVEEARSAGAEAVRVRRGERPDPTVTTGGTAVVRERPEELVRVEASAGAPAVSVRRAGDRHLLVELGPPVLDLAVRLRGHLLADALRADAGPRIAELVEGVRSLLVEARDGADQEALAETIAGLVPAVPDPASLELDVREVHLPLALDHPLAHEAMRRYQDTVRPDAPWGPDNVEFIRRVNGLERRDDVFATVLDATYLVLGLGDVYLGAPVAVPLDPRHRLVTTKHDPARPWTPSNAVGIGGAYLCVYGMEGPGGYQLVGRTVPVWRLGARPEPWSLRQFDLLRFHAVSVDELEERRRAFADGSLELDVRPATLSLRALDAELEPHRAQIDAFLARRDAAFAAERSRWAEHDAAASA